MYIFGEHGIFLKDFSVLQINSENVRNFIQPYTFEHPCFGHDLHITRLIIFDLLNKEIINSNDTIIITKERQFLYDNIFKNVITFNEFVEKLNSNEVIFNGNEVIFLPILVGNFFNNKLDINNNILKKNFNYDINNSEYWNEKLVNKILNIKKYNTSEELNKLIENKFIVFVIRTKTENDLCIEHLNQLKLIREKTNNKYKVILFCLKDSKIDEIINKDLYDFKIKNIHEFITLIINDNCFYLLGEISGLIESSYYYHGKNLKILEYVNVNHYNFPKKKTFNYAFRDNILARWNAKYIEPINFQQFVTFEEALISIE